MGEGTWSSESGTTHLWAAFELMPGAPWNTFIREGSPPLPKLVDIFSLWFHLGEALRAMYTTSNEDTLMLLDANFKPDKVMVHFGDSFVPEVALIDYRLTMVCCPGKSRCSRSLREGTGLKRTFHFPWCSDKDVATNFKRMVSRTQVAYARLVGDMVI